MASSSEPGNPGAQKEIKMLKRMLLFVTSAMLVFALTGPAFAASAPADSANAPSTQHVKKAVKKPARKHGKHHKGKAKTTQAKADSASK
jgi:hypothetical protein